MIVEKLSFLVIYKFSSEQNCGRLKVGLAQDLNRNRPLHDQLKPNDLCIFSGGLEIPNILTLNDLVENELILHLESREDGVSYPVLHYRLKSEEDSADDSSEESEEFD